MRFTRWTCAAAGFLAAACLAQSPPATQPANLLTNGTFEAAPTNDTPTPGWSVVKEGSTDGEITLDAGAPGDNGAAGHGVKMAVTRTGDRLGVACGNVAVRDGQWYDATFLAQTTGPNPPHIGLVFSLESADGKRILARATIPEIGGPWKSYTLALQARGSDEHARLVISLIEPCTMWLDNIALVPRAASATTPGEKP
jgi:hypothetical protein